MSKTYVLQRDLPMIPKGTEIKPLSALAYGVRLENGCHLEWVNDCVQNNPSWFKLKEDKIEVVYLDRANTYHGTNKVDGYAFATTEPIPSHKYPLVRQAIEFVLNDKAIESIVKYMKCCADAEMYTEKELLDAEEKSFYAAREQQGGSISAANGQWITEVKKYTTFTDYKNNKTYY